MYIDVPIDLDGLVARNKGSLDQWCSVLMLEPVPARSRFFMSIRVNCLPESTNTWKY